MASPQHRRPRDLEHILRLSFLPDIHPALVEIHGILQYRNVLPSAFPFMPHMPLLLLLQKQTCVGRVWLQKRRRGTSPSKVLTAYAAEIPPAMISLLFTVFYQKRFHENAISSVTFIA